MPELCITEWLKASSRLTRSPYVTDDELDDTCVLIEDFKTYVGKKYQGIKVLLVDINRSPAPMVAESQSGGLEPNKAGLADKDGWVMKKNALIDKHADKWKTIKADFHNYIENGLSKAAKAPGHGDWFEDAALNWARQRGKLTEQKQQDQANSVFSLVGAKYTTKD